jgi:hypothetical protein
VNLVEVVVSVVLVLLKCDASGLLRSAASFVRLDRGFKGEKCDKHCPLFSLLCSATKRLQREAKITCKHFVVVVTSVLASGSRPGG